MLDGDFLLPALAVQAAYGDIVAAGQVRALFLYEDDEEQLRRNYRTREGEDQPGRARASWRHSAWLRQDAERRGIPAIPTRPWGTVLARAIAALEPPAHPG